MSHFLLTAGRAALGILAAAPTPADAEAGSVAPGPNRRRWVAGIALVATGTVSGVLGLFVLDRAVWVFAGLALGALAVFLGVALLSPLVAGPVTGTMARPLSRLYGTAWVSEAERDAVCKALRLAVEAGPLRGDHLQGAAHLVVREDAPRRRRRPLVPGPVGQGGGQAGVQ